MKYPEHKNVKYADVAEEVLRYWQEHGIFDKSVSEREGQPTFTFYEGPPSANGTPGIHHVMARTVKDIFCRYKTMQGFQVKRKGGWDTHGLPVELQVEKELGITKDDIGKKISVAEYNQKCREAVMRFKSQWDDLTVKMGYWVDLDDPYVTFERDYMESLWNLLKRLYDKGLLYKGYTIQPFSPAAGTGLSSHELNQPGTYKMVKDVSITAQFKVKGTEDEYFLAWTTTPWTLPSNSGLAVGKNIDYVKVRTFNPYTHEPMTAILAESRMGFYFNAKAKDLALADYKAGDKLIPYELVGSLKGSELVGMEYEQLMPYVSLPSPAFTIIVGDHVTTEDGTGIVHMAMAFGGDDFIALKQAGLPGIFVQDENGKDVPLVDRQGKFRAEVTDFAGMYVKNYTGEDETDPNYKSTDVKIGIFLKEQGKAFNVQKYEHTYPHCWRTDKPVLYYPLDSWFIKTTAVKDRLVELNKTINWKPTATGSGRFGNWLENLVDWNLSRSRYWGTPLPIWRTEDGSEEKCIGSVAELKAEADKAVAAGLMKESIGEDFDLHRPYVDDVVLVSDSGKPMHREPDLIDVWFDSGAMPYAQWHFPFEKEDTFKANFPADFIAEGVDQTRGWFFTLHALATMLYDGVAYKNVMANGLVLDKVGNKMSKRLGNAIDPFKTLADKGADPTRWYMISNANPWDNLRFDLAGVDEVQRRFFGTLANTYSFFALYANLDGFTFAGKAIALKDRTELDRWILSRLNSLIGTVAEAYDAYEPTRATRAIQDFVTEELSNWYVRLNRKRFWKPGEDQDKQAAYQTLYSCLLTVSKLMAPVAPFYADRLFQDLNSVTKQHDEPSVHLTQFPVADESSIDTSLERRMQLAQQISSMTHALRKKEKMKVRQPLRRVLVPVLEAQTQEDIEAVKDIILSEVNIKVIEYIDDSGVLVKKIKPNFPKLGKQYGSRMKDIAKTIGQMSQEDIAALEGSNAYDLDLGDTTITLKREDVDITSDDIPGWSVVTDGGLTVALDVTLTDGLRHEGIARELVNRLQNLRKDNGMEVQDKVNVQYAGANDTVQAAIAAHEAYICAEVQAVSLAADESTEGTELDLDGIALTVAIAVA